MNIYKNRHRIWMRTVATALVCLFFVNLNLQYCSASELSFEHKLNVWSQTDDPEFREILMLSAVCRFIESEGGLGQNSAFEDLEPLVGLVAENFQNVKIHLSPTQVIFDIPEDGLSLRYFNPVTEPIVTPFGNVLDVRTRPISDGLWCQAIKRAKVEAREARNRTEEAEAVTGEYQFLTNPEYRDVLIASILEIARECREREIETIFSCGFSAKPTAQLLEMVWRRIYPDVPFPRVEHLEHAGQLQDDRYNYTEVLREIEAIDGLPQVLSKPILLLDDTVNTGQSLRKTREMLRNRFHAEQVFAGGMLILNRSLPGSYEDDYDWDPMYLIEIRGAFITEYDERRYSTNAWQFVRRWIRRGFESEKLEELYERTQEQHRRIFEEYLPHDFQMLSREAHRAYITQTTEQVKGDAPEQPMYIRPPPARFIERNEDVMDPLARENAEPTVLRFPVEQLEQYWDEEKIEFLNTFQSAPNAYVELYTMSGVGDVGRAIYAKYGIQYKAMPEEQRRRFQRNRRNTITLLAAEKGEVLSSADLRLRLGSVQIRPEETILVPFGAENDSTGIMRSTVVGLRLVELARRIGEEGNVTANDRDFIRSKVLEPYKDLCDLADIPGFDITSDDILKLVFGTENAIRRTLNKLIKLLPVEPIDAEELKTMHELAIRVLQAA